MSPTLHYTRLDPGGALPPLGCAEPFRAIVLVRRPVDNEWRNRVSDWLVAAGCLYMLAWGHDCSKWDDAVDWANIAAWHSAPIPEDRFVMTTWHEDERLDEVLEFAKHLAHHPLVEIGTNRLFDIADVDDEVALQAAWRAA